MTPALVAVIVIVGFAAATQSITGFGFALIVVPGLTLLFGPKVSVVAMSSVGVPLVAWNAVRWRADIQRREAITVTLAALLGMPIGIAVLTRANDQALTAIVGVIILVLTAWLWRGLQLPTGRTIELTAGFASGALAASVGTNGPPLVIAFQATGMAPEPFRATLQVCFFVQGAVVLLLFWSQGLFVHDVGPIVLVGLPAAALGALLGDRFASRVHQGPFRTAVLALLALSGVLAVAVAARGG
ncbi:MAG: sulfite exporter TauE/SafE family protein [Actinomycetota bacterium]